MPKISVLMSVGGKGDFLSKSLESLAQQTSHDFECLIVDDAADASARGILESFAARDPRFKIIRNTVNQGLGHSLNTALAAAQGEYVARMDDDDIALPMRFEKQVAFLDAHPEVTVVGTWAAVVDAQDQVTGARKYPAVHSDMVKMLWANPLIHPSVMMRREALVALGGYPLLRRKQDYALWFKAAKAGWSFANLPEELLLYRVTDTHFKKTRLPQAWAQLKIGVCGYASMGGRDLSAYAGMAYPFLRALLPLAAQRWLAAQVRKVDPRTKGVEG